MFRWIMEEAQEQAGEACMGNCNPSSNASVTSSVRTSRPDDSDQTIVSVESDARSFPGSVSSGSSRISLSSEETSRRDIQNQAHILTQKIRHQELMLLHQQKKGDCSVSSSVQYFAALNDREYAVDDASGSVLYDLEDDSDSSIAAERTGPSSKKKEEEKKKTTKKKWMRKRKSKDQQKQEQEQEQEQEQDFMETGDLFTIADVAFEKPEKPGDFTKEKNLAKNHQKRRKLIICSAFLSLAIAMLVLGVLLVTTGKDDTPSNVVESSSGDFEGPTIRMNPSIDDSFIYTDTEASSSGDEDHTAASVVDDNIMASTSGSEDSTSDSTIDNSLITSHMEAYEQWKQENGDADDEDSSEENADLDLNIDVEFNGDIEIERPNFTSRSSED